LLERATLFDATRSLKHRCEVFEVQGWTGWARAIIGKYAPQARARTLRLPLAAKQHPSALSTERCLVHAKCGRNDTTARENAQATQRALCRRGPPRPNAAIWPQQQQRSAVQCSAEQCSADLLKALLNAMSNGMHDIVSSSSQPRQYFQATSCRRCRMHDYKHYKQCILHVDCNHENAPLSTLAAIATIVRREAMPSS
jgi:hypothetical protein